MALPTPRSPAWSLKAGTVAKMVSLQSGPALVLRGDQNCCAPLLEVLNLLVLWESTSETEETWIHYYHSPSGKYGTFIMDGFVLTPGELFCSLSRCGVALLCALKMFQRGVTQTGMSENKILLWLLRKGHQNPSAHFEWRPWRQTASPATCACSHRVIV